MAYTPLTLTAVDYLSKPPGTLGFTNTRRAEHLSSYTALPVIAAANKVLGKDTGVSINVTNFPAVINLKGGNSGMTQYIVGADTPILSAGNAKFAQAWGMATGYIAQINEVINATKNSASHNAVFKGNDAAMSGNLTLVSTDLQKFATDLGNTGELFDNPSDPYSNPVRVARKILKANGRLFLVPALLNNGLTQVEVDILDSDNEVSNIIAKKIYDAFTKVTAETLTSILDLMSIKTTGLMTLADLFDLRKMFPSSYNTLLAKVKNGNVLLFSKTPIRKDNLLYVPDVIIPEDLTIQLTAFATSLQQVIGINNLTMASVTKTAQAIQTSAGQSAVTNATKAVSSDTASSLTGIFATGSGDTNTLVLADVLGVSIGYSHYDLFAPLVSELNALEPKLTSIVNACNAAELPATTCAAAKAAYDADNTNTTKLAAYNAAKATLQPYITAIESEVTAVYNANKAAADKCQTYWTKLNNRINNEESHQVKAFIVLDNLQNNPTNVLTFSQGLHKVGEDTIPGNQRMVLEHITDTTAAGQTVIACMKEGQNIKQMQQNGLTTTNFI